MSGFVSPFGFILALSTISAREVGRTMGEVIVRAERERLPTLPPAPVYRRDDILPMSTKPNGPREVARRQRRIQAGKLRASA